MNLIACILPNESDLILNNNSARNRIFKRDEIIIKKLKPSTSIYDVHVQIGQYYKRTVGILRFESNSDSIQLKYIIVAACLISLILFLTMTS